MNIISEMGDNTNEQIKHLKIRNADLFIKHHLEGTYVYDNNGDKITLNYIIPEDYDLAYDYRVNGVSVLFNEKVKIFDVNNFFNDKFKHLAKAIITHDFLEHIRDLFKKHKIFVFGTMQTEYVNPDTINEAEDKKDLVLDNARNILEHIKQGIWETEFVDDEGNTGKIKFHYTLPDIKELSYTKLLSVAVSFNGSLHFTIIDGLDFFEKELKKYGRSFKSNILDKAIIFLSKYLGKHNLYCQSVPNIVFDFKTNTVQGISEQEDKENEIKRITLEKVQNVIDHYKEGIIKYKHVPSNQKRYTPDYSFDYVLTDNYIIHYFDKGDVQLEIIGDSLIRILDSDFYNDLFTNTKSRNYRSHNYWDELEDLKEKFTHYITGVFGKNRIRIGVYGGNHLPIKIENNQQYKM